MNPHLIGEKQGRLAFRHTNDRGKVLLRPGTELLIVAQEGAPNRPLLSLAICRRRPRLPTCCAAIPPAFSPSSTRLTASRRISSSVAWSKLRASYRSITATVPDKRPNPG